MTFRILVWCEKAFIGDTLFAGSIAKKLKEKYPGSHVTYAIRLIQPKLLLKQNPYIDAVYMLNEVDRFAFNLVVDIPFIEQCWPVTIQYQAHAGIEDQSTEYDIYTVPEIDLDYKSEYPILRQIMQKPLVAYQANWDVKSRQYSREEYENGMHGHRLRDIGAILRYLTPFVQLIKVGYEEDIHQQHPLAHDATKYAETASKIKHCDWMIGGEGGLTNLAAGVGTKVIMTTDFMWHLYGPNGRMKQFPELAMGPATYYPDAGHVHLDPYLTDEQVVEQILTIINPND